MSENATEVDTPGITMREVPQVVQRLAGHTPSTKTIVRWRTIGVSGVVLKTIYVAGRFHTSESWIAEFLDQVSAMRLAKHDKRPVGDIEREARFQRELRRVRTDRILAEFGLA